MNSARMTGAWGGGGALHFAGAPFRFLQLTTAIKRVCILPYSIIEYGKMQTRFFSALGAETALGGN